ncbi:MAG: BadM/Rrf2 family transcriptional regulator [Gammaproteobacteria bacterium CG11_big_fil_rev_8_21_14_0_20_46_22]|nr:MAG: BadM/Rrf2 family transcriptional regulator [Gammaproteobacteria bacterium CG12_big_fil_rev_8_21_14_0_65_46_12]PIR10053.1 MAG: BadM/Rrf2 family transcriptional regulator [Gammaproteobacteria bacterium CG11_big_fil_rev_8_21_14_0_20_46_22]
MQLTQFTDYALRTLIYIATKQEVCTITEIAESYQISRHHLVKVVHKLGQLGYLKTIRGKSGGLELSKTPREINLGELIQKTEPNFRLVECIDNPQGTCCIIPVCKLKKVLEQAKAQFLDNLAQYTLADVTKNQSKLADKLKIIKRRS